MINIKNASLDLAHRSHSSHFKCMTKFGLVGGLKILKFKSKCLGGVEIGNKEETDHF
jgi:hypothetical protein